MASVWEIWGLAALSILQFAVAYWWWTGPHLEGSRGWVSALFLLGGLTTLQNSILGVPALESTVVDGLGGYTDRGSNLCLLAFGLLALNPQKSRPSKWFLGIVASAFAISLPFMVPGQFLMAGSSPDWALFLFNLPLWLAILVAAAALIKLTKKSDRAETGLWLLALSGIGFRFAELTTWLAPGKFGNLMEGLNGLNLLDNLLQLAGFPAMLIAFSWMLWRRASGDTSHLGETYDVSLVLVLSGFLFGFARVLSDETAFAVFFSMALVRPLVFLTVQWKIQDQPLRDTTQWRHLRTGGSALGASLLAIPLGGLFGMGVGGSVLVGAMLAALALVINRISTPTKKTQQGQRQRKVPGPVENLPLDSDNVPLPDDSRERVRKGLDAYRRLSDRARSSLTSLARWERILLALYAAPEEGQLPPYERTTPGLHFVTHTPYASIGSEVTRTNERVDQILQRMGIEQPSPGGNPSEALIESKMGHAQDLDSPRVKSYALTDLGVVVAEEILEDSGLADIDKNELIQVLGEGYAEATPSDR